MTMSSSEFKTLIEQNVGEISFEDTISKNRFSQLRLFLEKELGVKVPDQWSSTMTYINLWRKVNTLTEAKKQNKKGKGTKKNNESSVVIVKSKPDHLPVNNKVAKKITEISSQIEDDKEKLDNYLEEIQNAEPTIDIGSFLGFLPVPKKGDVESAIYQVYDSLCEYIVTCGNAIRSANGNISNILELIQLLATAEADIYNLIDNQALASNELRILIKEWCKEHGIHDEEVDKLLESSFQRAYTLRDRLNSLKEELYSELNKNKEDVEKILREIPDYKEKIQQSINEALTIIEGSKDKNIAETDIHFIEKKNEINSVYELLSDKANKELDNIEAIKHSIDEKKKEFGERVASYFEQITKKEESLNQQSHEIREELSSLTKEISDKGAAIERMTKDALANLKDEYQASIDSQVKSSQAFHSEIQTLLKNKGEDIDNELKRIRESQDWLKKDLNKVFDEKYQGWANLHKQFVIDQTSIIDKLSHQVTTCKIVAIAAVVVSIASLAVAILH